MSKTQIEQPREAKDWMAALQSAGIGAEFDGNLAATLRVVAGLSEHSVCMCSGAAVLPYVTWLRDGMSMNSCLVILLNPDKQYLDNVVQQQLDRDVRVASHYQELESFCQDISRHRVDLFVSAIDGKQIESLDSIISLLNDNALIIAIGDDAVRDELRDRYSRDFFVAEIGNGQQALALARKGIQHNRGRTRINR